MLAVKQFRFGPDNLGYVVYGAREAIAIDGGAAEAILEFIESRGIVLSCISNTHDHSDHTPGNRRLKTQTAARLIKPDHFTDGERIELEGESIRVYRTPGHSADSVCFHAGGYLITGDTLFNGTVGNCFTGDLKGFYESIKKLMALPEETIVYAGHDYVRDSLSYAAILEPGNEYIGQFLSGYSPEHVFSTLKDELRMNPFLRMNEPGIAALLEKKGLPCGSEWERWRSLMTME